MSKNGTMTKLKKFRLAAGLSQSKIANAVGVTKSYISAVELGKNNTSVKTAKKIADVLKLDNWYDLYD